LILCSRYFLSIFYEKSRRFFSFYEIIYCSLGSAIAFAIFCLHMACIAVARRPANISFVLFPFGNIMRWPDCPE
jgi:hypothetical protein